MDVLVLYIVIIFLISLIETYCYETFSRNKTQRQCTKLADHIDACLALGQYDREEIKRWRSRLRYIGSSKRKSKRMKKEHENVTRTSAD